MPHVPRTVAELVARMSDPPAGNYNQHFKATVELGIEVAVIFMSAAIIPRLAQAQQAFYEAEAVFFRDPFLMYHLFSIMAVIGSNTVPVAIVLMRKGNLQPLYHKVTHKIRELAPDFAPDIFICNYDTAVRNALQASFPAARFYGCQYHYSQELVFKWDYLGLTKPYKKNPKFKTFLRKLMSIPYLPARQISGVATALFDEAMKVNSSSRGRFRNYQRYFFSYWLHLLTPEKFSVYDLPHGTNNYCTIGCASR